MPAFKPHKPDFSSALRELFPQSYSHTLPGLSAVERAHLVLELLQQPEVVSHISEILVRTGYGQGNLLMQGRTKTPGDQLVLSRWKKAASGATIMATRENATGELEILFGRKQLPQVGEFWALPGGHYELDEHANLEHTLVAELIEETGIIPLYDEFLPYIIATIVAEKGRLPYADLAEAEQKFISRDLVWEFVAVISGEKAHWEKRAINIGYRVHFYDGAHLQPKGSDDLGELRWFTLSQLHMTANPTGKVSEENIYLPDMRYGNDVVIETAIRKMRAWELSSELVNTGTLEDIEFFSNYLEQLKGYSLVIEEAFQLKRGTVLANCLTGPHHRSYLPRALALHNLRPRLEAELDTLEPGNILHAEIERRLIKPFMRTEDYV